MPEDPASGEAMYREHILDHYKSPRNFGRLKDADIDHRGDNPLCGDECRITATVQDGTIEDIRFDGQGCAISQASTSLLTTKVKGMPLDKVRALTRDEVVASLGIPVSPVRLKCAVLGLTVLQEGVEALEADQ